METKENLAETNAIIATNRHLISQLQTSINQMQSQVSEKEYAVMMQKGKMEREVGHAVEEKEVKELEISNLNTQFTDFSNKI